MGEKLGCFKRETEEKVIQSNKYQYCFVCFLFLKAEDNFLTRTWPIPDGKPPSGGRWCFLKTDPVSIVDSLVYSQTHRKSSTAKISLQRLFGFCVVTKKYVSLNELGVRLASQQKLLSSEKTPQNGYLDIPLAEQPNLGKDHRGAPLRHKMAS